ncbi:polysaccharide biosynthesis tyrosine autokinase [Nocardioides bizhenqiangii]|uniref:non-specific protein-tyrosine kinase n=1 Tax=Nocardioides bizhenqiangii TaxID=3095076 RepID=A0ABZ0ZPH6_9ACTN|nr:MULTISPECIES: polysaccharide biosynthesis tyrosine autokinase [unclassified Nocardioides]MDZ5620018.1 polysaccharide biosynthesis tyrosine autokinase [Nocardioides sp. HM23]WQQ25980.1 polysaccharide biosynthesis tyrosine autokinase [Nocardioides sp. HM61]
MDFKQFLLVLRRRWRSAVAVFLLAVGISTGISLAITPQYESTAKVFLAVDVRNATDAYAATLFLSTRAESYADLAGSSELAERVIDVLDLDMTAAELSGRISSEVIEETSLITITVTDPDARQAQKIADVVTSEFQTYTEELETPGDGGESQIDVRLTDAPEYNPDPVKPNLVLNIVAGALIGLLLGIALAVAREVLDRTVRTAENIAEVTDAPVLASVGFDNQIKSSPLLTDLGTFAARTEAFRLLRTNLQFIDLDQKARVLVVTSAVPGEGKTMTATNLAIALAQTGRTVLIVDADLRRPRVASALGVDPAVGLTTALVGKTQIEDAIQVHEASGLHVLASGAKPPNPTEILQSRVTHDLIRRLRQSYDMIIIDAPPLLPVADASVLSTLADGAILVVRHGQTTRDQVVDAVNRVTQVGGRLYGVVVNMVAKRAIGSYYYYYYEETKPVEQQRRQGSRKK